MSKSIFGLCGLQDHENRSVTFYIILTVYVVMYINLPLES